MPGNIKRQGTQTTCRRQTSRKNNKGQQSRQKQLSKGTRGRTQREKAAPVHKAHKSPGKANSHNGNPGENRTRIKRIPSQRWDRDTEDPKRNKPTKQHTPGRAQSNPPGSRGRKEAPTTDKEGPRESNKRAVYGTKDPNSRNLKTRIKRSSTPKAIETQETLTRRERATGGKKPPTGTSPTGTAKTRNLEGKRNKRGLRKKKRASHPVLEERANPEKRKQPREKT